MAPLAQAPPGLEQAGGPADADGVGDDWVSLILNDVGTDLEADNHVSLGSLALPDLDDLDFGDLDEPVSSNHVSSAFRPGLCRSGMLFDPLEVLQDADLCPGFYHRDDDELYGVQSYSHSMVQAEALAACPSFSDFSKVTDENAEYESPESELSRVSHEQLDVDAIIPAVDSCSDKDSPVVSDVCSEGASCKEAKTCKDGIGAAPGVAMSSMGSAVFCANDGTYHRHQNMPDLQSSSYEQNLSHVSDMSDMSASKGEASRKRKYPDRTSRSNTPDGITADGLQTPLDETDVKDEDEERRKARLMRNRESAQLSRQRKKIYVDELEEKIKTMASTIAELNNTISLISAENVSLRRQLGMLGLPPGQVGGIPGGTPWVGAYPPGPIVGNRFMMPGVQVPLVPIPRWKSQQATTLKKTRKAKAGFEEKGESEKSAKKTKKVAGIAAAGLFFFVFVLLPVNFQILGLRPIIQREAKVGPTIPWHIQTSGGVIRAGGRVLTGLDEQEPGTSYSAYGGGGSVVKSSQELETCNTLDSEKGDQRASYNGNASVPLAATLFVPRNDQLVRIEGSLIINSILAGDKAANPVNYSLKETVKPSALQERSLALKENLKAVSLKAAPQEKGALVELQRALGGKFDFDKGDIKPIKEDGSLQRWFVEDFTGSIFSSGLCTEVFQFEISPVSSMHPPGSGSHVQDMNAFVENKTTLVEENNPRKVGRSVTYSGKTPSYAVPLPPVGHKVMFDSTSTNGNFSGAKGGYGADNGFTKQKHGSSSVVVSLLTGPELGEHPKLIGGRKVSRIFVVVLVDSIKYVTYSCMLPSTIPDTQYEVIVA